MLSQENGLVSNVNTRTKRPSAVHVMQKKIGGT